MDIDWSKEYRELRERLNRMLDASSWRRSYWQTRALKSEELLRELADSNDLRTLISMCRTGSDVHDILTAINHAARDHLASLDK